MKSYYKPRAITADGATWRDVADECYAELSADGKAQVDNMTEWLLREIKSRHTGHNALGLGHEGARELLCALIGGGWW